MGRFTFEQEIKRGNGSAFSFASPSFSSSFFFLIISFHQPTKQLGIRSWLWLIGLLGPNPSLLSSLTFPRPPGGPVMIDGSFSFSFFDGRVPHDELRRDPSGKKKSCWGAVFRQVLGWWLSVLHAVKAHHVLPPPVEKNQFTKTYRAKHYWLPPRWLLLIRLRWI